MPHTFKARPTTDFAKENLFNVLSNYMDFEEGVRALDLFAGTGSISIELVSRGCDQVISVEKDRDHYAFICKVMKELKTDKCLSAAMYSDTYKAAANGSTLSLPTRRTDSKSLRPCPTLFLTTTC